ncbi:hypothetical protein WJX79_002921 [Trebouxia sp. C0005]
MPDVLPLSHRPFDIAVVAFLVSHIPVTILIDSQPFFPPSMYPSFARNAFTWYIAQFQDPLMTLMPAWFRVLCWRVKNKPDKSLAPWSCSAAVAYRVLLLRDDRLLSVMAYYKISKQALAVNYTFMD